MDDDDGGEVRSSHLKAGETLPLSVVGGEALAMARRSLSTDSPPAAVVEADAELTQSSLRVRRGDTTFELPLMHTDVDAEISGFIADVAVHQLYSNPFEEPIEVVYLFPLPDSAAVDDMQMRIGDRVIIGEIKRRAEAKQIYEAARDAGKTAALLDQERPNVFQQSVANILPGESIEITIHFVQRLDYEDGGYEWVFPMVVGPRFIPAQGTGTSGGTTPAEDAERLNAPVSAERTGNDITISVTVDAGLPIQEMQSPSHDIDVERPNEAMADVVLSPQDSIPNKDFVLRYKVAGDTPEMAFLTHRSGEDGYFMLLLQPQAEDRLTDRTVTPKEMVFVIDTSCSQSGEPLARAKEAVELAIDEMNPMDRFWILNFNSSVSTLSASSLANTPANRRRGLDYIRSFRGGGGTNMVEGIRAALDLPSDPELLRTVVLMTDGYIGNETEILSEIEQRLGNARLFSFGVGSSTNRYLLNRIAKVGRGHVQYIRQDENPTEQVKAFYDRIRNPVLTDIELDWDGIELLDVYPDPIPDLFSAQPLVLVGRYDTPGKGSLTVSGKVRGQEYSRKLSLTLPEVEKEHDALASLWARTVIEDLESRRYRDSDPDITERITELALEHRLMTRETSFVAVEERIVTDGSGAPKRVRVPLETPEGVSHSAIFGETSDDRGMGAMIGSRGAPLRRSSGRHAYGSGSARSGTARGYGGVGTGSGGYGRGAGYGGVGVSSKEAKDYVVVSPAPEAMADSIEKEETDASLRPDPRPIRPARSSISLGDGSGLSTGTVRLIERRLRGIESAWADWVRSHAGASGGVWKVRLSLDAEGKVVAAKLLVDGVGVPALAKSFEAQALNWRLPVGSGGASEIEFELHLSAGR
jgi:Ca-activated chloride channel family protein